MAFHVSRMALDVPGGAKHCLMKARKECNDAIGQVDMIIGNMET